MEWILQSRRAFSRLGFQARVSLVSVLLFALLVITRIHGSSIAFTASAWSPEPANNHYLAAPILRQMAPKQAETWRARLLAKPSWIRVDEFAQATPWALAQSSHEPPFPVVNQNMGGGQNMLLVWSIPVWHLSAFVRPATWGYLLFGTQVGLAWSWWFPVFFCFVGLVHLLRILLPDRRFIGVFCAVWYCASAYVTCWSLWPAYFTGFGVWSLVCAVRLLSSNAPRRRLGWGLLLGLAFSGFVLLIYPPWQVPLGLTLVCLFAALCVRDGLLKQWRSSLKGTAAGLAVATLFIGSYYVSAAEALHALAGTVYPGARRLLGGDCSLARLASAFYNYQTLDRPPGSLNPSEAGGFFLLFPAAIIAGLVSKDIRSRLGVVAGSLAALALFFVYFCVAQIPEWLATVTLMSRVQGFRAQIAIGLISVLLCALLLDASSRRPLSGKPALLVVAGVVFFGCGTFFLWTGAEFQQTYHYFPEASGTPTPVLLTALAAAGVCTTMALGLQRLSAASILLACVATSWGFNPLSSGFPPWQDSPMGQAVQRVSASDSSARDVRPLWLTFGGAVFPGAGTLLQVMGARTLAGVYHHPQLQLWRPLDPLGKNEDKYNRFAHVGLVPLPLERSDVVFQTPPYNGLLVFASPLNSTLSQMGAKYVFTQGMVPLGSDPRLRSLETSQAGRFSIWQLPDPAEHSTKDPQ